MVSNCDGDVSENEDIDPDDGNIQVIASMVKVGVKSIRSVGKYNGDQIASIVQAGLEL